MTTTNKTPRIVRVRLAGAALVRYTTVKFDPNQKGRDNRIRNALAYVIQEHIPSIQGRHRLFEINPNWMSIFDQLRDAYHACATAQITELSDDDIRAILPGVNLENMSTRMLVRNLNDAALRGLVAPVKIHMTAVKEDDGYFRVTLGNLGAYGRKVKLPPNCVGEVNPNLSERDSLRILHNNVGVRAWVCNSDDPDKRVLNVRPYGKKKELAAKIIKEPKSRLVPRMTLDRDGKISIISFDLVSG